MRVLVTGGTGVLGREVARRLRESGQDVRVLSRRPATGPGHVQGDLETGTGLDSAVAGVDVIAHCASKGSYRHAERDVTQTRNLLAAASAAHNRPHIVYISIIGVDRIRASYHRAKLDCERLIETSGLPWTVLRAAQFHELLLTLVMALAKSPVVPVPSGLRSQPVEVGEVADRMVDLVLGPPSGRVPDLGGPCVESMQEMTRAYLTAARRRRLLLPFPLFGKLAADFRAGYQLPGPGSQLGHGTFADYLRTHVTPDRTTAAPYSLRR
jgi:uncharacterized protein YbjT (DUF2867 family)